MNNINAIGPNPKPVNYITGTNFTYTKDMIGQVIVRNNNGVSMVDTLPLISNGNIPNGWYIYIKDGDTGGATLQINAVAPNKVDLGTQIGPIASLNGVMIVCDGENWVVPTAVFYP